MRRFTAWLALAWLGFAACNGSRQPGESVSRPGPGTGEAPRQDQGAGVPAPGTRTAPARHILLTLEVTPAGARVVDARMVNMAMPPRRRADRPSWTVEVLDAAGAALFSAEVGQPDLVHGEFPDAAGAYQRHEVRRSSGAVAVRIPILDTAQDIRVSAPPGALVPSPPGGQAARAGRGEAVVLGVIPYPRHLQ
jgi:hypothetical protein